MIAGIPKATAQRISLYLQQAETLREHGQATVSSEELAKVLGLTATQVRKDLAYFGQFGRPGVGYQCDELIQHLRRILGTDQVRPVALVGAGNLGRALASYPGFQRRGFKIVAVFDNDLQKVGKKVGEHIVQDIAKLPFVCRRDNIRLAILSVPAQAAQNVADQLVEAGVQGLLNFAPATLSVPAGIAVAAVALSLELEQLGLAVKLRQQPQTPAAEPDAGAPQ
jgi:redox-sensing transcriptional repressor